MATIGGGALRLAQADHGRSNRTTPEADVRILMVDDQPSNLLVLESVLENLGYRLVRAGSGEEALKRLLQEDFAVILMDVFMPGMDGFETAELIRQRERSRFTPIIFLTAIGTSETHVTRGYSVGAVDYLFKPIVPEILQAKVGAFVELFLKTAMVAEQAERLCELERQRHQAELTEAKRQLQVEKHQQDVRAARTVQQMLFPHGPPSWPGLDIAGASYSAGETGGDYFDYILTSDNFMDVVIGDVSGHGFAAALLMSSTRAYLRALAEVSTGIDQVLKLTNRALAADMNGSRFVTLFYLRFAPDHRSLRYASAGHPSGYVMSANGEIKSVLESTAMPLGILDEGDFPTGPQVDLQSGDLIFLFTDGVTEAVAPNGTLFGTDRAIDVLRENRSRGAAELVESLYREVTHFMKHSVLEDDVTTVVIKVL